MSNNNYQDHQVVMQRTISECVYILKNNPVSISAFGRMGDAYMQLQYFEHAFKAYNGVLSIDSKNISALVGIATIYVFTNKFDDAIRIAKKALKFSKGNIYALGVMAAAYERKRSPEKIIKLLKAKVVSGNRNPVIVLPYARALEQTSECKKAIKLLEESLKHKASIGDHQISTHFLLGKLYDKKKEYDCAFNHFESANKLKYVYFDPSRPTTERKLILNCFTPALIKRRQPSGINTDAPVFIVGMPRSGTTLVDRIISSHPNAVSAGELLALPKIVETMCHFLNHSNNHFTSCVEVLTNEEISILARQYLDVLENKGSGAKRITDKMPVNFMYLGMIEMMFPNAKIINCIRDPADLCLSCYIQDFHGSKPFLNKLDEIAMIYRNYKILIDHWKATLSIPIYDIEYETLVAEPATEIPKLINYIGLSWDDKCFNFHKEGQFINTVSYDQVDKPMYQSSIGRWRHYEKYMKSLRIALGEYWPK